MKSRRTVVLGIPGAIAAATSAPSAASAFPATACATTTPFTPGQIGALVDRNFAANFAEQDAAELGDPQALLDAKEKLRESDRALDAASKAVFASPAMAWDDVRCRAEIARRWSDTEGGQLLPPTTTCPQSRAVYELIVAVLAVGGKA